MTIKIYKGSVIIMTTFFNHQTETYYIETHLYQRYSTLKWRKETNIIELDLENNITKQLIFETLKQTIDENNKYLQLKK